MLSENQKRIGQAYFSTRLRDSNALSVFTHKDLKKHVRNQ